MLIHHQYKSASNMWILDVPWELTEVRDFNLLGVVL